MWSNCQRKHNILSPTDQFCIQNWRRYFWDQNAYNFSYTGLWFDHTHALIPPYLTIYGNESTLSTVWLLAQKESFNLVSLALHRMGRSITQLPPWPSGHLLMHKPVCGCFLWCVESNEYLINLPGGLIGKWRCAVKILHTPLKTPHRCVEQL